VAEFNDAFHTIFDVVTWRSPLKRAGVRRVIQAISPLLEKSLDPTMVALGLGLRATTEIFEKRYGKGGKK